MSSVCSSPISVQPLTLLVDCWLRSEEVPKQMAISSAQNSSDKSLFLRKLTGFVPQLWIFDRTLSCFVCSSLHLCLSSSVAQFQLVPLHPWVGLPRISSFTLSLSPFCPRHNSRRRSLFMRVLSHSDTHHLNRHMVGCGCHEILIPCSTTVLFSTTFLLISISRAEGEGEFIYVV